jgi:hypothetical protein
MAQIANEAFTVNLESPVHSLGEKVRVITSQGLKEYQFVKFDNGSGNVASVAGNLAYLLNGSNFTGYTVTMDVSDTKANMVAGVFTTVLTDGYHGWIQTAGYNAAVKTNGDDDISAGDMIVPSAAGDGTCDSTADGTAPVRRQVGVAVAADVDADNTVAVYLTL